MVRERDKRGLNVVTKSGGGCSANCHQVATTLGFPTMAHGQGHLTNLTRSPSCSLILGVLGWLLDQATKLKVAHLAEAAIAGHQPESRDEGIKLMNEAAGARLL
jgi:hypothetical protein